MGDVIDLSSRARRDRPATATPHPDTRIMAGTCATLIEHHTGRDSSYQECTMLLAYENGRWVHTDRCRQCRTDDTPCPIGHAVCDAPQPTICYHGPCSMPADIDVVCTAGGVGECCGCCWAPPGREAMHRWHQ